MSPIAFGVVPLDVMVLGHLHAWGGCSAGTPQRMLVLPSSCAISSVHFLL